MTTTSPRPIIVTGRLLGAGSLLPVTTGLVSAAAVAVGVLEARLPPGPGNTAVHHGYPFFAVSMALVFTAVGRWVGDRASRWSLLSQVVGLASAVNALLIGLLAYTVTPAGHAVPVGAVGWLADVSFPVCDVAFLGLLVGLLPDCRPQGGHRLAVQAWWGSLV